MSIVKCSGLWIEDIFAWFLKHVCDSGGDGAGAIVCSNYQEACDLFLKWFAMEHSESSRRYESGFYHPREEYGNDRYGNVINFHDDNENFLFSDTVLSLHDGDYVFVITGECKGGWKLSGETLKPLSEEGISC